MDDTHSDNVPRILILGYMLTKSLLPNRMPERINIYIDIQPSRHGPDFHRPQSQITIDSPDFHLRQSQNCLLGNVPMEFADKLYSFGGPVHHCHWPVMYNLLAYWICCSIEKIKKGKKFWQNYNNFNTEAADSFFCGCVSHFTQLMKVINISNTSYLLLVEIHMEHVDILFS